jgi:hypothetical protein
MKRFPREPIERRDLALPSVSRDGIECVPNTPLNRLLACEPVEVDGVEHVRLDDHDHYLAYSLYEALVEEGPG